MVKVLMVVCNNVLNGTERYVVDLAKNLSQEIFDVYIATPMKGPLSDVIAEKNLKEIVFENSRLNSYTIKGLHNLYRIIRNHRFDVVHANAKFHPCALGKLAGAKFNVETKHGIFYSKHQLDNLPLWRRLYERSKMYFVDRFIATSENDKAIMIKYFRLREDKISVIYLGLDFEDLIIKTERAFDIKKRLNKDNILIGHIGRFTYQKAQEVLLESFRRLSPKYPGMKLEFVGSGENEKNLRDFVKRHGLVDKVIFKGYIKDIYRELSTFDMHVLTSRFEGTGYVNLEAMAIGVPAVMSEVGGANNFFRNGYDALLTVPEDPASTAGAIESLIENDELRSRIITNAIETVKKYDIKTMALNTAKFYLENIK